MFNALVFDGTIFKLIPAISWGELSYDYLGGNDYRVRKRDPVTNETLGEAEFSFSPTMANGRPVAPFTELRTRLDAEAEGLY